MVSAQIE